MLTVVCGEDTVSSRSYLMQLRASYARNNVEIRDISPADLPGVLDWQGASVGLFSDKTVFFIERLEASIVRKRGKKPAKKTGPLTYEDMAVEISKRKDIELVDWEQKPGRDIKLKNSALVKEFKPSASIFKLLDACYPGNLKEFITLLRQLSHDEDETFIFIMLYRHIKTLIGAHEDVYAKTCPPWQKYKLSSQAKLWAQNKLVEYFEGLFRLETSTKSGTNPHGIRKTLEILSCYYL